MSPDGGTIRIHAETREGLLVIVVADDGAGASGNGAQARNGIGLGALRERLALTYDGFDLSCDASDFGGYTVRLTVPAG